MLVSINLEVKNDISDMHIYIISDTHYGHVQKMMEYCGRPADYEDRIDIGLGKITRPPTEELILIHLGDIAMKEEEKASMRIVINTPDVKRILVRGNHDKKSAEWYLKKGWDFVVESMVIEYLGKTICLSHKPMVDFGYDINIHGHFHNSDHHFHEPELIAIKNNKQYLLAIENTNYQPVLLDNIIKEYERNNSLNNNDRAALGTGNSNDSI